MHIVLPSSRELLKASFKWKTEFHSIHLYRRFTYFSLCTANFGKLKGCVRYIFASLFFKSNESTCQPGKIFLFYFKSSFRSGENQIFVFQIFKFYDAIKCLSIKQEIHFAE